MSKKLLQVEHLSIALKNPYQDLVKDISFSLEEAGAVILLGQSGSGKTMTCRAILGLLNSSAFQVNGEIFFENRSLLQLKEKELLESAGWVDSDGDGIREKDGAKLSVTLDYITNQGTMDDAALVIAQELGEVGFEVTPRGSDNMTWFTQVSTDFDFSLHTTYGGYYDPFLTMTNMNPEMMSDPILWQVALTMENGTDTIKELDSTADLDRVQEIYSEVLTFAADQAVLVPFTSAHQYAAFNSDKIDSFSFGSDQLFIEIANVKAK